MKKSSSLTKQIMFAGYKTAMSLLPQNRLGDKFYAIVLFVIKHKRLPKNRMFFNDVLFKMKTTNEILDPLRVFVSDKELLKTYVKATVGDKYNVPTLGVIKNAEDVDSYNFPDKCCIKPTQASGQVILRTNSENLDKSLIKSWFKINFYKIGREVNYRNLKPKIIIEPLIFGSANVEDYKFFCVNGVVKLIQVDVNRYIDHKRMLFDANWAPQSFSLEVPRADTIPKKPANFDEMLEVAQKLAAGFSFVRIDLYSDGKNCLVGEITNCHGNAGQRFIPKSSEERASKMLFG